MQKILEKVLAHIPRYFETFWGVLGSPHSRMARAVEEDDRFITNAWVFFMLSIVITEVIRYTNLGGELTFPDAVVFGAVKKAAVLFAMVALIFTVLAALRRTVPFRAVTAVCLYVISIVIVLIHIFFLVMNGLRAINPCDFLEQDYGVTQLDCAGVDANALLGPGVGAAMDGAMTLMGGLGVIALCGWLVYAWFVWRRFAEISLMRCSVALILVLTALPMVAIMAAGLFM